MRGSQRDRVDAATAAHRAKARYLSACRGGWDGRELPLLELAQRRLAWEAAIVVEIDAALQAAEARRNEIAEAVLAQRATG